MKNNKSFIVSGQTDSGKEVLLKSIVHHIPKKRNPLIVITGRTSSGKDTLARHLLNHGRTLVVSHTTRDRRPGEGDIYHFIDNPDDYPNKLLPTKVNGNYYFILEEDIYKHDVLVVDAIGVQDILNLQSFTRDYRVIYLDVDEETRKSRYIARANTDESDFIKRRDAEVEQFDKFEKLIESKLFREKNNITIIRNRNELSNLIEELHGIPLEL